MADDVIDRRAERMAVAPIAKTGGNRALVQDVIEGDCVEPGCGRARNDLRDKKIKHLRRQASCPAHPCERIVAVNRDCRVRPRRPRERWDRLTLRSEHRWKSKDFWMHAKPAERHAVGNGATPPFRVELAPI
jgi:hypothetical protein